MAPKRRREPQTPPEIGTPGERVILQSLGEMTGMFREWVTGQNQVRNVGHDLGLSQNREVEERHNEDQPPIGEKTKSPLDIMKEVHKSKLAKFSGKEGG